MCVYVFYPKNLHLDDSNLVLPLLLPLLLLHYIVGGIFFVVSFFISIYK